MSHMSPREIGRTTGAVAGSAALAIAPAAAAGRLSSLRSLREAELRPNYLPPDIGWAKETFKSTKPWKAYNDAAPGAVADRAPTLMRTMPDGSKRPVKFDGVQGDYVVDRKFSISTKPRARDQVKRQAQALSENRLIGTWEVPDNKQKNIALKLLKEMKVHNIKVRIAKP